MDARGARATVCPRSRVNFCRAGLLLRRLKHIVGKYGIDNLIFKVYCTLLEVFIKLTHFLKDNDSQ